VRLGLAGRQTVGIASADELLDGRRTGGGVVEVCAFPSAVICGETM
jgi:hypothetical protein